MSEWITLLNADIEEMISIDITDYYDKRPQLGIRGLLFFQSFGIWCIILNNRFQ